MKRNVSLILSCLLIFQLMMMSGCKKNEASVSTPNEPTKLTILSPSGGRVNKADNVVVQEIEKKTNTKLEINLIPDAEFVNKFNVMVASNSVADVVKTPGYEFFNYIPQAVFMDITKLVEEHGKNLKEKVPQQAWEKVKYNGKLYVVPSYNWPGKMVNVARKDWLDKLGMKAPTNLDELREMYKQFTYNDPDGDGIKNTYGLTTANEINSNSLPDTFVPIFGAFGVMPGMFFEKDGKAYPASITPEYKAALEYIGQLYNEDKVIDPDMFILKTDQATQNLVQGRSGSFAGWWSIPQQSLMVQKKMKSVNPNAEWEIIEPVKGKDGKNGFRASNMVNYSAAISANCKNPAAAMKLMDFLVSDEGAILSSLGLKDVHYVEENGQFVKRTEEGQKAMDDKWVDVLSQIVFRADINRNVYKRTNPEAYKYIEASGNANLYYDLFEGYSTPATQKNMASIKKVELEWLVKFVVGKEPISKYDEYVQSWLSKGGKEVLQSLTEEYNKRTGSK